MTFGQLLKKLLIALTWSTRPEWISPPLRAVRFKRGRFLKRIWTDRALRTRADERAYVGLGVLDTSYIRDRSDWDLFPQTTTVESCRACLETSLSLPLLDELVRDVPQDRLFKLDMAIVEMNPGMALLRWDVLQFGRFWIGLFGFFGLGHAWVQIEGILTEPSAGRELLKFVERRRHSGIAKEFSRATPVDHLITSIARDSLHEIYFQMTGKDPTDPKP